MISEGHKKKVIGVCAHPMNPYIIATIAEDNLLRIWDIEAYTMNGFDRNAVKKGSLENTTGVQLVGWIELLHTPTSVVFANNETLLVSVSGADTNGNSASIFIVSAVDNAKNNASNTSENRFKLTLSSKLHNIGIGAITQLQVAPNKTIITACSNDGCVYVYQLPSNEVSAQDATKYLLVGYMLVHPTSIPVVGLDFSSNSRYVRTFGSNNGDVKNKIEVNFFDFELSTPTTSTKKLAAGKIQDLTQLENMKNMKWASVSSYVAPEVKNASISSNNEMLCVESVSSNANGKIVFCGYNDGSVQVFRTPIGTNISNEKIKLNVHSTGPVLTLCTASASTKTLKAPSQFVSIGQKDGSIFVWNSNNE